MGEWVKGVGGNLQITNEAKSKRSVIVQEHYWEVGYPFGFKEGFRDIAALTPGDTRHWHDVNGLIKLVVADCDFLSASDVAGGCDACFGEGRNGEVWVQIRG